MNNCAVCDDCFRNENPNKIICDGICRQSFHAECANFSKKALLCYREMPNLQWFCDGCIIQTRSSKELLARVEREAILQNENCQIKIRTIEVEAKGLKEEILRLRDQCTKQSIDLQSAEEKLESVRDNFIVAQEELIQAKHNEKKYLADKLAAEDLMIELGKEVERLRSENLPALPTT